MNLKKVRKLRVKIAKLMVKLYKELNKKRTKKW